MYFLEYIEHISSVFIFFMGLYLRKITVTVACFQKFPGHGTFQV